MTYCFIHYIETEELSFLFYVRVLHNHPVSVCLHLLLGQPHKDHGGLWLQSLASCSEITCFRHAHHLHIHRSLVRRRLDCLPPLLSLHQPGLLSLCLGSNIWYQLHMFHLYVHRCFNSLCLQTTYENFRYRYDGKMNPYNRGCIYNVKEVLFSGIPKSINNFRAKVTDDLSRFTTSHSLGRTVSTDMAKPNFDLEVGLKRHSVAAEEPGDIQNKFEIGALERCEARPPHSIWDTTDDVDALSVEFGMGGKWETQDVQHGYGERVKTRSNDHRVKIQHGYWGAAE